MSCHPKKIFETEFKTFLHKVSNNPAFLKNNSGELRRILNKLKSFDKDELDSTLNIVRRHLPHRQRIYVNAHDAIQEIERVFIKLANNSKIKETTNEVSVKKLKTSPKRQETTINRAKK